MNVSENKEKQSLRSLWTRVGEDWGGGKCARASGGESEKEVTSIHIKLFKCEHIFWPSTL